MLRRDFIKTSAISAIGLSSMVAPSVQATAIEDILTGKTTSHLESTKVMHSMAYRAYLDMRSHALNDGIDLSIASGFRSFDRQLGIYNRKYKRYAAQGLSSLQAIEKIILYSTIPGTSRHHWGTDIDLIDLNVQQPAGDVLNENNYHGLGPFCKLKEWMEEYSEGYGFYLTYTASHHRTGFNYEPWHYSYAPIAVGYLKEYLKLDINTILGHTEVMGKNDLTSDMLEAYKETHVLGINPVLLPS